MTHGGGARLSCVLSYPQFQPEEPEVSEPSRGEDSPADQKQADSVVGPQAWAHGEGRGKEIGLAAGCVPPKGSGDHPDPGWPCCEAWRRGALEEVVSRVTHWAGTWVGMVLGSVSNLLGTLSFPKQMAAWPHYFLRAMFFWD